MKKILYILIALFFMTGCTDLSNTPTKQTEAFFKKYQALDKDVINDLNNVDLSNYNDEQSKLYRDIMKRHYQNLTYEIKEETVDGDDAVVKVEITVTDFKKTLDESNEYLNSHIEEFQDELGNYDESKYIDYRLEKLKNAKEKIKYTINISLTKINDKWTVDNLTDDMHDKIDGIYNY